MGHTFHMQTNQPRTLPPLPGPSQSSQGQVPTSDLSFSLELFKIIQTETTEFPHPPYSACNRGVDGFLNAPLLKPLGDHADGRVHRLWGELLGSDPMAASRGECL